MSGFAGVLIGYGNNGNSLRVWDKGDGAVCHSMLPEIHQFSEPDR